mmetsp:Transcript_57913/g.159927  ORF Transcript_57913/g.159927 Transcript_57913/m.159927 type:complete len:349 (-) Transcript_57913:54-1100(-)
MTVVVRCNLGWGELARGGLKCGWKELGFRLTPRPSLLFTVEVDYELHIKNGAFSLADLPVLAIYTTDATTSSGNTEEGEEAIVVLRDEPVARSRADVGNYLVGSTTAAATIEDDKGHLIHTLQAAGLHKLEHGQAERPPRSVSHVLHVLENLPDEASHGGDGTFSVRARSIPPASLFSRGRIAVNYNHTTPRPVRRKSASELEDAAEAAHAAAKAAGRRLSDENVATESICESQCDSSWNFFYKNWLTSSYFMDEETNNCGIDEAECTLCLACFEWSKEPDAFQFNYNPETEGAVTSEYEIISWDDLETKGKVVCKDCWANLGTEVKLLVDWDECKLGSNLTPPFYQP